MTDIGKTITKDWCLNMAKQEGDQEIGAGQIAYDEISRLANDAQTEVSVGREIIAERDETIRSLERGLTFYADPAIYELREQPGGVMSSIIDMDEGATASQALTCCHMGLKPTDKRENITTSAIMALLEEIDGELDRQLHEEEFVRSCRNNDLDVPADCEHHVIITEALWRKIRKVSR